MASKVFVSPGVYTSERDISFVTRQIGVTSLGVVGETLMGPAFQPIFVSNFGEFTSFFGGKDTTIIKENGAPKYELPYIAESFLSQGDQLFVTRVLGLSGYDAGKAWGITLDSALDVSTIATTISATNKTTLISFTATTGGTNVTLTSGEPLIQSLINDGTLTSTLAFLGSTSTGATASTSTVYLKTGANFSGVSFTLNVTAKGTNAGFITGSTSGVTTYYSGTSFTDVENTIVALLRSRGSVNSSTQAVDFELSAGTSVGILASDSAATTDYLASFTITGNSTVQGVVNYNVSLDKTKKNYLPKVLGRSVQDGKAAMFIEEFYPNLISNFASDEKIRGIKLNLIQYSNEFFNYLTEYKPAVTPYVVSELRGNKVLRLFRLWTISDGNAANEQFKISILNINPDTLEFDIHIRSYGDTDAKPVVLESFSRCTMDPSSKNFVANKIGTLDGQFPSKSVYVLLELDDAANTSDAFPAGFEGFPTRDFQINSNTSVVNPTMLYKKAYNSFENKRKAYLGLSDTVGVDSDVFDYKGIPDSSTLDLWTGTTKGFHMDVQATAVTIDNISVVINASGDTYSPVFSFETGEDEFKNTTDMANGPYEKLYARKFTFAPYGGFDGWDIYRTRRSNLDNFTINGTKGAAGLLSGAFQNRTVSNGDRGINSDYYAYLEGIYTFNNPEAVTLNVITTPGIDSFDNSNLIDATIEMVEEERGDCVYLFTTPDTDTGGEVMSEQDVVDSLDGEFDSNYSATYWPWIQKNDVDNNKYIWLPPTADVVRNMALTDKIAFPWYAVAGIGRGDVIATSIRKKLTNPQRDILYAGRVNPITYFASDGYKIWGNKTMQIKESALDRLNVRRMLLQARKLISAVGLRLLFEQDDAILKNQFLGLVNPILDSIKSQRGITEFKVEVSQTPEDLDRNAMVGKIRIKPTKALEFLEVEFEVTNQGATFSDI